MGIFTDPYAGLAEYREAERWSRATEIQLRSAWKLNQEISVGGQALLGIKYLSALRRGGPTAADDRMRIWPFETGWTVPDGSDRVVAAENFPSVLPIEDDLSGLVRDLAQVRTCVRHAAALGARARLGVPFGPLPGLADEQLAAAAAEDGWFLFVRRPRLRGAAGFKPGHAGRHWSHWRRNATTPSPNASRDSPELALVELGEDWLRP